MRWQLPVATYPLRLVQPPRPGRCLLVASSEKPPTFAP